MEAQDRNNAENYRQYSYSGIVRICAVQSKEGGMGSKGVV